MTSFQTAAGVLGGLLVLGALLSGLAHRSVLSLAAVFVLAGFVLGEGATGVLHFKASSGFVTDLATVALIVILFRDGLEIDAELLQREWRLPLRKLAIGMPLTAAIVAVVAHALIGLSWVESFLLGALLSPTDPILSSGVVQYRSRRSEDVSKLGASARRTRDGVLTRHLTRRRVWFSRASARTRPGRTPLNRWTCRAVPVAVLIRA